MNKNFLYIAVTGVVAVTLIWLGQNNKNEPRLESPTQEKLSENTTNQVNTLEGILWSSDNKLRGNLMLVGKYSTFYLKTARDFNNLIGRNVLLTMDGILDNFTLLNIEENLTKDGFIRTQ